LQLPEAGPAGRHAWHLFVVQCERRDALQAFLAERGIGSAIHYPAPPYRCRPFAAYAPAAEAVSDRLCARVLSLPMGPHLADHEVDAVVDAVRAFVPR
jgi:dTDP-4-amino-4,6-dideoxygalactose transaminase